MRDKYGAAVSSGNDALVLQTQRLAPFGSNFESAGGNLTKWKGSVTAVTSCLNCIFVSWARGDSSCITWLSALIASL